MLHLFKQQTKNKSTHIFFVLPLLFSHSLMRQRVMREIQKIIIICKFMLVFCKWLLLSFRKYFDVNFLHLSSVSSKRENLEHLRWENKSEWRAYLMNQREKEETEEREEKKNQRHFSPYLYIVILYVQSPSFLFKLYYHWAVGLWALSPTPMTTSS